MDELTVAFAGVVSGAVVGTVGTLISWRIAKGTWKHERTLRIAEKEQQAYVDMLELANLAMLVIERTEPQTRPKPHPPELPSDAEWAHMDARITLFGDLDVRAAWSRFAEAYASFFLAVADVRQVRSSGETASVEQLPPARELAAACQKELEAVARAAVTKPPR